MIQYQHSLKELNSFRISAKAEAYLALERLDQLALLSDWRNRPNYILGGGSNILLAGDLPGLVIHNQLKGKRLVARPRFCLPRSSCWRELAGVGLIFFGQQLGGPRKPSLDSGFCRGGPCAKHWGLWGRIFGSLSFDTSLGSAAAALLQI